MRIGLILSKPPSYSETFFINKIKGLQSYGHEVALYVQANEHDFTLCPVYVAPSIHKNSIFKLGYYVWEYFRLLCYPIRWYRFMQLELRFGRSFLQGLKNSYNNAHLLKAQLDWIHFGFTTMGLQREHIAKAIQAKSAVSFRGYDLVFYPLKHEGCYDLLWPHIDKVHTISDDLLALAYNLGLPKSTEVQKITPAINTSNFLVSGLSVNDNSKPINILTIGRLHWIKGYIDMLKALAIVKQQGVKFFYTIIGEGADFERISFAAHEFGLAADVQFIGKVAHDSVRPYLADADIYLQYSISEGFCNAALEAQAMGCLCIVSDAGGLPENILHQETGWVVPKFSIHKLAETIISVTQLSEEQKRQIRIAAQERVKSNFNLELQAQAFHEFYIK